MLQTVVFKRINPLSKNIFISNIYNSIRFHSVDSHYDIIIVGGGLIGSTLACTLGKNTLLTDKRILLLEAGKKRHYELPPEYGNRVSALNPGTKKLLNDIGVWKHIESARFCAVKDMQVWENNSEAAIHFKSEKPGTNTAFNAIMSHKDEIVDDSITYIVENDVTLGGVYNELQTLDNVEILHEAFIQNFQLIGDRKRRNEVTLKNDSKYSCDLLVGCDGYQSQVRKAMGVHYVSGNYNQMGIVATLELEEAGDNTTAWQRHLPTGTVALLPLNKELSSLVWCTTPHHAKELISSTEQDFVENLNTALCSNSKKNFFVEEGTRALDQIFRVLSLPPTRTHLLPPKIVGCREKSRAGFPLGYGHAASYITKGVALLGDAAHRVHPLAGQGVNLGFGDIACFNKVVGEAVYCGSEIGSQIHLKDYESERQRHNVPTMVAIDGIQRLYSTEFPPLVLLRSMGVQTVNALGPLKGLIQKHASS